MILQKTVSETIPISHRFKLMKCDLPRGKLSRWAQSRWIFNYEEGNIYASKRAIWELKDYGEKTRERWEGEYRHQRKLRAIENGTDYNLESNK